MQAWHLRPIDLRSLLRSAWGIRCHSSCSCWKRTSRLAAGGWFSRTRLPKISQTCSIRFISGETAGHTILVTSFVWIKSFTTSPRWQGALSSMNTALGPIVCSAGMAQDLIPVANDGQVAIHTVKGCSLMVVDASPYHYWSTAISVMLSDRCICIALPLTTPNTDSAVFVRQIKARFVCKDHIWPLCISPSLMDPRPAKTTYTVRWS